MGLFTSIFVVRVCRKGMGFNKTTEGVFLYYICSIIFLILTFVVFESHFLVDFISHGVQSGAYKFVD